MAATRALRMQGSQSRNIQPDPRDHGIMSDYHPHVIKKVQPVVEAEGDFPYDRGEEFPVLQPPKPTTVSAIQELMDPNLCLSPERVPSKSFNRTQRLKGSDQGLLGEGRNSKVRFDHTVEVKEMSPNLASLEDSTSDGNVKLNSRMVQPDIVPGKDQSTSPVYFKSAVADQYAKVLEKSLPASAYKPPSKPGQFLHSLVDSELALTDSDEEPISVFAADVTDVGLEAQSSGDKLSKQSSSRDQSNVECTLAFTIADHALSRREVNSSLFIAQELQKAECAKPDLIQHVEHKLSTSDRTKMKLEEKAYSKLNYSAAFECSTALDVSPDEIIKQQQTADKARRPTKQGSHKSAKVKDSITPPDIFEFFTPALQKESPSFSVYVPPVDLRLQTVPPNEAFTLYRHLRSWEKL